MKFKESRIAHIYLDGLRGIEIGASAHNPFGLDTINVDRYQGMTAYKTEEVKLCGEFAKVDIVANGDNIPVPDKSFDFVISSHVIEHFYNPIKAIKEWERIATKYIFMIVPHRDRTFDNNREASKISALIERWDQNEKNTGDEHYGVYTPERFEKLMNWLEYETEIIDPDDKVGNGFIVIIKL